jgi:hypothetical protein
VILLWGIASDSPLSSVRRVLSRFGARVAFLDQQAILETKIELTVDDRALGTLHLSKCRVALEDIGSVYVRPYDVTRMAAMVKVGPASPEWVRAVACEADLASWTELTRAEVVNRLSAMGTNASKPYQSLLIRAAGFDVPDTLMTTDRAALTAFLQRHGSIIYKSVSGIRSIVSRFTTEHDARLDDIATCPTQFQEYVDGKDIRIHVIGDEIFGCEIESSSVDYRYGWRSGSEARIRTFAVPTELADRCHRLVTKLDLSVAGIDLRRRSDGRWCCFEVNPSPAYTYYEAATGQPIGESIANLLMRSRSVP